MLNNKTGKQEKKTNWVPTNGVEKNVKIKWPTKN